MSSESDRTPAGMLGNISGLLDRVESLEAHVQAIVSHLSGGGAPVDVPTTPPVAPAPPAPEEINVANALASLTPEQRAALKALLGG